MKIDREKQQVTITVGDLSRMVTHVAQRAYEAAQEGKTPEETLDIVSKIIKDGVIIVTDFAEDAPISKH